MLDSRRRRGTVMLQSYMSMYCFGGYDRGYRNDFHEFSFGKLDVSSLESESVFCFASRVLTSNYHLFRNKHLVFGHSYRAPATTSVSY
ncbi:hypothetical protein PsorP6_006447 [Peronosclerospora sorghi]|uniref:Uncharacterized protein n=1 Tax=Peronosclerospora sorghi TaxID=230839 RepID=A0ACC0W5J5_9STRA|nr:hypothetical protein PsorP6_006447 [Peronosclerospora sorghi]